LARLALLLDAPLHHGQRQGSVADGFDSSAGVVGSNGVVAPARCRRGDGDVRRLPRQHHDRTLALSGTR
jgi:hypothetical protein